MQIIQLYQNYSQNMLNVCNKKYQNQTSTHPNANRTKMSFSYEINSKLSCIKPYTYENENK
jgi:hypothetical protein